MARGREIAAEWGMVAPHALDTLDAEASRLGLTLEADVRARFGQYLQLVLEWTPRAGLTSAADRTEIPRRHFGESLSLLLALRESGVFDGGGARASAISVVDIGAGAGFPGLAMRLVEPSLAVTLVESNAKRCRFLEHACAELGLGDVRVVQARAEEAGRDEALRASFDVAVARAVAPMPVLVEYALPLLRRGGVLAALKGGRAEAELAEAAGAISALGGTAEPSLPLSLPAGAPPQRVLLVRRTGELDERYPRRPGMPSKRPLR